MLDRLTGKVSEREASLNDGWKSGKHKHTFKLTLPEKLSLVGVFTI